jgi:hypothetical protein
MSLLDLAGGLLQQYLGPNATQPNAAADQHFDQISRQAPPDVLSQGLAEAFRSDKTPPFPQMAADLFARATPEQKQALLSMLGMSGAAVPTSASAAGASPAAVQSTLEQAQKHDPSIVDTVSDFYAQHPQLIKTIGSAALTIALAKMAQHSRSA